MEELATFIQVKGVYGLSNYTTITIKIKKLIKVIHFISMQYIECINSYSCKRKSNTYQISNTDNSHKYKYQITAVAFIIYSMRY